MKHTVPLVKAEIILIPPLQTYALHVGNTVSIAAFAILPNAYLAKLVVLLTPPS